MQQTCYTAIERELGRVYKAASCKRFAMREVGAGV